MPPNIPLHNTMTTVQKHRSQQQTLSLGLQPITHRTNLVSFSKSQRAGNSDRTFQLAPSAKLEPQQPDHSRRRVPRAFLSSGSEAMSVPLTEDHRLPAIKPTRESSAQLAGGRQSTSPTRATSRVDQQTLSPVVAEQVKYVHGVVTSRDPNLRHLATNALHAVMPPIDSSLALPRLTNDISVSTRKLSLRDDQLPSISKLSPDSSKPRPRVRSETMSPPSLVTAATGELPPLQMDSPKSDGVSQSLPSIRSTFGDINCIPTELPNLENEVSGAVGKSTKVPASPSGAVHHLPLLPASHTSPPMSPNEVYPRNIPSPHAMASLGGLYGFSPGSIPSSGYDGYRTGSDGETAHSPSASSLSHISIDRIANGQIGSYFCTFDGCTAHPFQTQYLLNSHANVHSSARPHYCPVKGCPRSEGGKGFKRKNEMIRHGLVHDSPGYVCPFCPDREHKYPRPDNLQR